MHLFNHSLIFNQFLVILHISSLSSSALPHENAAHNFQRHNHAHKIPRHNHRLPFSPISLLHFFHSHFISALSILVFPCSQPPLAAAFYSHFLHPPNSSTHSQFFRSQTSCLVFSSISLLYLNPFLF